MVLTALGSSRVELVEEGLKAVRVLADNDGANASELGELGACEGA